jgi:hypothetical protein
MIDRPHMQRQEEKAKQRKIDHDSLTADLLPAYMLSEAGNIPPGREHCVR